MAQEYQIEKLIRVRSFIETHFREDIKADELSELSHYSYRNTNRLYKVIYGESIGVHIRRLRL